ncbi:MAG: hypothetical protein F4219_04685 [Gammaproteobacteria bacterium]|nr:hypothetical protein [Gammaproteobacteria bacterium]
MKNLLAILCLGFALTVGICINADEEEENVDETSAETEESSEESDDDSSKSETDVPADDSQTSESDSEAESEETEEPSLPPPTAPWKRLPISTTIPVNYDIDLPQDI